MSHVLFGPSTEPQGGREEEETLTHQCEQPGPAQRSAAPSPLLREERLQGCDGSGGLRTRTCPEVPTEGVKTDGGSDGGRGDREVNSCWGRGAACRADAGPGHVCF